MTITAVIPVKLFYRLKTQMDTCKLHNGKSASKNTTKWMKMDFLPSEQKSVLTRFRVWVSVSLGAAVWWCLLIVLFLGEAEGERLGGAGSAARLWVSEPAVTATLLGTVGKMERHAALGLEHTNKQAVFPQQCVQKYNVVITLAWFLLENMPLNCILSLRGCSLKQKPQNPKVISALLNLRNYWLKDV